MCFGFFYIMNTFIATTALGDFYNINLKGKIKKYYKLEHVPECTIPKEEDLEFHSKWNNCFGQLIIENKQLYIGEWKNGKPDGKGTFYIDYHNNKLWRYEGSWKNGEYSGRGVYVDFDKKTYIGEFKNSERHGKGTLIWPNGLKREVTFKNGKVISFWNNASSEMRSKAKKKYLSIQEEARKFCDLYIHRSKLIQNESILNKSYIKYDLKAAAYNKYVGVCIYSESFKSAKEKKKGTGIYYEPVEGEIGHSKTPMLLIQINPVKNTAWFSKTLNGSQQEPGTCFWRDNLYEYQHNVSLKNCYGSPFIYDGKPN